MKNKIVQNLKLRLLSSLRLTIWVGMSLIVGLAGPFGTFTTFPLFVRLVYWTVLIGVSILFATVLRKAARAWGLRPSSNRFLIAMPLVFGAIFAPFILVLGLLIGPPQAPTPYLPEVFVISVLVFVAVLTLRRMLGYDAPQVAVRLLQRLPHKQDQTITRLSVEDHYVIVYFADGSHERILMRLSDAIAEMEPQKGLSVHRSHWVAETMIDALERERGREFLRLTDGTKVPVGKKFKPHLEDAGFN